MAGRFCNRDAAIYAAMVATESSNVFVNTLYKAASLKGVSSYVFLAYNWGLGALLLLPFLFFSHRSRLLPPLSFSILLKMGLFGLLGSIYLMAGFIAIKYSSPTLASAMGNLTPAFTFILAVIFGMEKVSINKETSVAKMVGTIVSIGGALVATLYHGPAIFVVSPPSVSLHQPSPQSGWAIGGGLLAIVYILVPISYILQADIMNRYPSAIFVTFFRNVCVSVICALVGMIAEKDNPSVWIIGFDIRLGSIVTAGILDSWYYFVHSWVVRQKGPLFISMFRPLSIIIAVIMGVILLGDSVFLGSLIGGTLISIGFYMVMWAKAKEEKAEIEAISLQSPPSAKVPLLMQNNITN